MNIIKEKIISILNMEMVLNKYGVKLNHNKMFSCPFHEDKSPSAKCYDKSFYCFSCNRKGDLINFVQYLYNINFQQGMEKIIDDFGLGITTKGVYDKSKILEIEKERILKEEKKKQELNYFVRLCARKDLYNRLIDKLNFQLNKNNWEDITLAISYLQDKIGLLEIYICDKYNLDY